MWPSFTPVRRPASTIANDLGSAATLAYAATTSRSKTLTSRDPSKQSAGNFQRLTLLCDASLKHYATAKRVWLPIACFTMPVEDSDLLCYRAAAD